MSLRLIAKDLYRLQQKVDNIQEQLEQAPPDRKADLEWRLKIAIGDRDQVQRMLDGHLDR